MESPLFSDSERHSVTPMEHARLMESQKMSGSVVQVMKRLMEVIQKMSDAMGKCLGTKNTAEMADITRAVSTQMMYLSRIMQTGNVSGEEMQMLQQRIYLTEKRLEMMR